MVRQIFAPKDDAFQMKILKRTHHHLQTQKAIQDAKNQEEENQKGQDPQYQYRIQHPGGLYSYC